MPQKGDTFHCIHNIPEQKYKILYVECWMLNKEYFKISFTIRLFSFENQDTMNIRCVNPLY